VGHFEGSALKLFDAFMALDQVAHVSDIPGLSSGKK
jgi:hypothetical protein